MTHSPPANGFRTFVALWASQAFSIFGSAITFFAVNVWLVQTRFPLPDQKAQLALALVVISLAFALPAVLMAPISGVVVDRYSRKRIMQIADGVNMLISGTLALLVVMGGLEVWMLALLLALSATAAAFHAVAFDASYIMLVPEQHLPRANGMMQTLWSLSSVLSPGIAALLISVPALLGESSALIGVLGNGPALAFGLDALTFLVALLALTRLQIPSPVRNSAPEQREPGLWAEAGVGWSFIWQRKGLLWLLLTFALINFAVTPLEVFETLLLKYQLAGDWQERGLTYAGGLAILATAGSVGGLLGGVVVSVWGGLKTRRVYGILLPILVVGAAQVVFGLSTALFLSAGCAFVLNAMFPITNAHSQTLWQTQTPPEVQGRVFAVRRLIAQFTSPISLGLIAILAGRFDPGVVLTILGAVLLVFCAAQLLNPAIMRLEEKSEDEVSKQSASQLDGEET